MAGMTVSFELRREKSVSFFARLKGMKEGMVLYELQ